MELFEGFSEREKNILSLLKKYKISSLQEAYDLAENVLNF